MVKWFKGDALTVGELRKALEGVPDDAEVGQAILGLVGHVTKVNAVLYHETCKVLVLDSDKRAGSFTDDEIDPEELRKLG